MTPEELRSLSRIELRRMRRQFSSRQRKALLSAFFNRDKLQLNRCLAPGMRCASTAIKAHSISNSRVLGFLEHNGHVKAICKRIDQGVGPTISFENVGRNDATTFQGFCSQHDFNIFNLIDTTAFQSESPGYLFLLAYRAVAKEVHTLMDGAIKNQLGYQKRVDVGFDSPNEPSRAGIMAIERMTLAYETHLYKCNFDDLLVSKDFTNVLHEVIEIDHLEPTIAVCSLFSIDVTPQDWSIRISLNILPLSEQKSVVIFSFLSIDAKPARVWLSPILCSSGYYQKYLLSKVILHHCENFVIRPAYFDTWTQQKTATVTDYFARTLFEPAFRLDNQDLYLF
jgi:hypothetical protein